MISLEVVGMGDLTKQIKFVSPDDGNPDDKTVMDVALPRPVEPGQDVTFKIKFRATFPEVLPAPATSARSCSPGSGFPRSESGGMAHGTATNFML